MDQECRSKRRSRIVGPEGERGEEGKRGRGGEGEMGKILLEENGVIFADVFFFFFFFFENNR